LDTVRELLKVNWKETGIRLAGYAAFRARNLAWRTGSTEALARGMMPDDIAAQAILAVISGERNWEPDRGPLLPFLKRVVDSMLNHLAESQDNCRMEPLSLQTVEGAVGAGADCQIGAESLEAVEAADQRIERLFAVAEGKPELIEVLEAIVEFDETRPRFLAVRICKPVSHVNNCFKRLRRLALKITLTGGCRAVSGGASMSA
jgi:hypothetical protein